MDEQQIGYGISDFFKKHKILSKAMNFIDKSGLQDKVLDNLPVPGIIKNIGKAGIKKFSNFLQDKGYGMDLEEQIDYYIQPSIQPKVGLGLKELDNSVKKLDEIYHEIYNELQKMKERQQKKKEAPLKKSQAIFLEEKTDEEIPKKYEKSDSETEEQRKHRQFLLREAEQQRIIELNKQRQKDLPVHPLVSIPKKRKIKKTKEEIKSELTNQFKNADLINDNSDIIDDYLKGEIDYTTMQKEFSKIDKEIKKSIADQQKEQKLQQKESKKAVSKQITALKTKLRYYKNLDSLNEKQRQKMEVIQSQLDELKQ